MSSGLNVAEDRPIDPLTSVGRCVALPKRLGERNLACTLQMVTVGRFLARNGEFCWLK
jgi:hypothetical protein